MALVKSDMIRLGGGLSNGKSRSLWLYCTNDSLATVVTAGYFADMCSGDAAVPGKSLTAGDMIEATIDEDGTPHYTKLIVTDIAVGTVVQIEQGSGKYVKA